MSLNECSKPNLASKFFISVQEISPSRPLSKTKKISFRKLICRLQVLTLSLLLPGLGPWALVACQANNTVANKLFLYQTVPNILRRSQRVVLRSAHLLLSLILMVLLPAAFLHISDPRLVSASILLLHRQFGYPSALPPSSPTDHLRAHLIGVHRLRVLRKGRDWVLRNDPQTGRRNPPSQHSVQHVLQNHDRSARLVHAAVVRRHVSSLRTHLREELARVRHGVGRVERMADQLDVIDALQFLARHALADEPDGA